MLRRAMAKTAGFTLVEMMVAVTVIASLAAIGVPTFVTYRDRSRVAQAVGSSEAIRSAFASYAANNTETIYPSTGSITDYNSLRLVVNANGGVLPTNALFTVDHYSLYDSGAAGTADTYSMRLIVDGVSNATTGAKLLITPQGIFKCTISGNPC